MRLCRSGKERMFILSTRVPWRMLPTGNRARCCTGQRKWTRRRLLWRSAVMCRQQARSWKKMRRSIWSSAITRKKIWYRFWMIILQITKTAVRFWISDIHRNTKNSISAGLLTIRVPLSRYRTAATSFAAIVLYHIREDASAAAARRTSSTRCAGLRKPDTRKLSWQVFI